MKKSTLYGIVILGILISTTSNAQSKKDAVILYNSVPVEVEVTTDGEITKFKKERPGYLKGYIIDTKPNDPSKAIANLTAMEPEGEFGKPVSPERNFLNFDPGLSTLDPASLDILNSSIARLKSQPTTLVTIKASNPISADARSLNNVRLDACKKYLMSQGIGEDRILTTLSQSIKLDDRITLTFAVN